MAKHEVTMMSIGNPKHNIRMSAYCSHVCLQMHEEYKSESMHTRQTTQMHPDFCAVNSAAGPIRFWSVAPKAKSRQGGSDQSVNPHQRRGQRRLAPLDLLTQRGKKHVDHLTNMTIKACAALRV